MPSKSSGRIVKARKRSTHHQRNHRFETFTTKIAKFNSLQPLRKVRRHDIDENELSEATSYFQSGLQKWGELNISKGFANFKRDVFYLSESLPQLLHFEKRIFESLAKYIAMQEAESLEPLLDLLTAFAHDLGMRFEKHYATSLALLVDIAGKPQPVEVIEWTFGALAFLFKYLSKLLVPNLRPTYDVISPLMGKSRHPPHIARFAAEAVSFLVKKAGAPSYKETSLPAFVKHVKADLCSVEGDRQFSLYQDGVMTMFAEAIKGNDHTLHSSGPTIYTAILDSVLDSEEFVAQNKIWTDVACGVLTSAIHHTFQGTFTDLQDAVLEKIETLVKELDDSPKWWLLAPYVRVLGILGGVRKGSRVSNWPEFMKTLVGILEIISKAKEDDETEQHNHAWKDIMVPTAIVFRHVPTDALIPQLGSFSRSLTKGPLMRWFIPFCSYLCDMDATRFGSLLRGEFQRFIASHWSQDGNQQLLCFLLPQMIEKQAFPPAGERESCRVPQDWQDQIVSKFENLEVSPFPERGPYNKDPQVWRDRCLPKYSALLRLLELATVHPSTSARIAELLIRKLKLALRPSSTLASDEVNFIVSQGFHAYLRMSMPADTVDKTLSPLLRAAVPRFARSVGFLEAFLAYQGHLQERDHSASIDAPSSDSSDTGEDPVIAALAGNLGSPSHEIRLASLKLLKQMNNLQGAHEIVDMMIEIEQLPLALEHTRTISMLLRNLGQKYASLDNSSWLQKGVPNFAFGMLTVKLSPVWDNATEALQQIAQSKAGEEAVGDIAFSWLQVPSPRWTPPSHDNLSSNRRIVTDFDCTLLMNLHKQGNKVEDVVDNTDDLMLETFDERQQTAESTANNARSKALKVLNAIPSVAERRSRRLVPHFLPWALEDDETLGDDVPDLDDTYWSLVDRKGMLGVFSHVGNPKVLYQHERVYQGLLSLLENGDVENQKLALKGILTWKQKGVKAYSENLEYLLDEARFKNELTVFLQDDSTIKSEHRQELMPVLLRLLYGRTISKKGAASGKHGLLATRLAVLRNLSVEDMGQFLDIAAGRLAKVKIIGNATSYDKLFEKPLIHPRKQVGFLNMTSSLISELGTNVAPYMEKLLDVVLYCLVFACRQLQGTAIEADAALPDDEEDLTSTQSLLKVTRSTGIKCLIMLFQHAQDFGWEAYRGIIIKEVVAPRLDIFSTEMTQGISGVLQLLSTWAALPRVALFLGPHEDELPDGVLPEVIRCLAAEKAKDEVRIFILDIIRNLVRLALAPDQESEFNELIKVELIDSNAEAMLNTITSILRMSSITNDVLEACVEAMLSLAQVLQEPQSIEPVLRICAFLLQQPPRRVNPKMKGRLLLVVENFVSLIEPAQHKILCDDVYDTLASLFSYFKDRENRQALCRALAAVSVADAGKTAVAGLCYQLNSYKEGRIDEPDYEERLKAFTAVSKQRDAPLTPAEWLPLVHNCVFFIKVDEEFGVLASNSADGMRRLVQDTADSQDVSIKAKYESYLTDIVLPAVYAGARESSESTRREVLRVFSYIVSQLPLWEPVKDLAGLMEGAQEYDTESPFFFNILNPSASQKLEALRTLEATNLKQEFGSQNITQFFIPLLEHFIFGREEKTDDHGLGALATNVIGSLAGSLHWKHYRTTLQRYMGYIGSRPDQQKQTIRLLGKLTDALTSQTENASSDVMDIDQPEVAPAAARRLTLTKPSQEKLSTDVVDHFLPMLTKHLHEKDESEVSYRVPVGVTIVKLLKLLPTQQMDAKLAGVLTDICHILRSKATESRDLARDTLVQIATILGSSYFGFILRELRGALTKGYQLHVLSYTMHAILVAVIPGFEPGDLDYALPVIVMVIMDDIFGVIGQEKDAEGYTTQMKEIMSSKSQDSMELIAKTASITRLIELVQPLQALLMQKVDLKILRKIDTLMSRISAGLLQNPAAETRDTLVFCYEVIQSIYKSHEPIVEQKIDPRVRKYLVQKGAKKSNRGRTTKNTYKLMRFAIDMLRSMFKKHDSLRTPENLAGFLPILGDAILDGEDEVKISTFRLLAVIVKVPFPEQDAQGIYKVAVKEATKAVSTSVTTSTDLAQAALKMLSVVLRERKDVVVKEAAIDVLLGKLKDDLTEPQYRHVTFNFVRSVMERRIETAAVYDTMDHVGNVMITNDDKDTRDLARGAFFQFIRDYPQKKARWSKQINFIVANLKYDREGGRLSVMEVVHLLLMKSSDEFVQEVAATCFLPLFFVLANDESEKCCLSAAELLKEVFAKSDKERTQKFLTLLRAWIDKDDNPAVQRLALQVWSYYFTSNDGAPKNGKDFELVLAKVMIIISEEEIAEVDGEMLETVLKLTTGLLDVFLDKILSSGCESLWTHIGRCMSHPYPPVKLAAIKLISLYLADFATKMGGVSLGEPVQGTHGLILETSKVETLTRLSLNILNGHQVDEGLAREAGQILIFLGPRLATPTVAVEDVEVERAKGDGEEDESEQPKQKDLQYLFWRLSHILRKEVRPTAVAIAPKVIGIEVLETICRRTNAERLAPSFRTILTPLHNITDPTIRAPISMDDAFKTKHEHIKTRAQILMDALQKKFGTPEYTKQLMAIRDEVRARREQRASKRKIEAIAQPEKYGRDKRKKFEKNRERKKSRASEQKQMRQGYKNW